MQQQLWHVMLLFACLLNTFVCLYICVHMYDYERERLCGNMQHAGMKLLHTGQPATAIETNIITVYYNVMLKTIKI